MRRTARHIAGADAPEGENMAATRAKKTPPDSSSAPAAPPAAPPAKVKKPRVKNPRPLNSKNKTNLTAKQEAFVSFYMETGNASASYRRAYDCSKTKEASVNVNAHRLKNHPKVSLRIEEFNALVRKRAEDKYLVTPEIVLREYAKAAKRNSKDYYDCDGDGVKVTDLSELTDDEWSCIEEIDFVGVLGKPKIKFIPKIVALEAIARTFGMFKDNLDLNPNGDGGPIINVVFKDAPAKTID